MSTNPFDLWLGAAIACMLFFFLGMMAGADVTYRYRQKQDERDERR